MTLNDIIVTRIASHDIRNTDAKKRGIWPHCPTAFNSCVPSKLLEQHCSSWALVVWSLGSLEAMPLRQYLALIERKHDRESLPWFPVHGCNQHETTDQSKPTCHASSWVYWLLTAHKKEFKSAHNLKCFPRAYYSATTILLSKDPTSVCHFLVETWSQHMLWSAMATCRAVTAQKTFQDIMTWVGICTNQPLRTSKQLLGVGSISTSQFHSISNLRTFWKLSVENSIFQTKTDNLSRDSRDAKAFFGDFRIARLQSGASGESCNLRDKPWLLPTVVAGCAWYPIYSTVVYSVY